MTRTKIKIDRSQPKFVLPENVERVRPLIEADQEYNKFRANIATFLLVGHGVGIVTVLGFLLDPSDTLPAEIVLVVQNAIRLLGISLGLSAAAYTLEAVANWFAMRNRKISYANGIQYIGKIEKVIAFSGAGLSLSAVLVTWTNFTLVLDSLLV